MHYAIQNQEGQDIRLAMQELWLGGEVLPIGARLTARHVFESAEDHPLEVIYSFMLPRDAALRQFRIEGEGFCVTSELQAVKQAEEFYEEAMNNGYLASMTRNYRDGVTNLLVGNLQPGKKVTVYLEMLAGVEARDDGFRLRFPFTLSPAYHPQVAASVNELGEGEQELPEKIFGDVILPPWREDASKLHRVGFDLDVHVPGGIASVQSPSHTLQVTPGEPCKVSLSRQADVPNRDLVLDVTISAKEPMTWTGKAENGTTAFAAWIPSTAFGEVEAQPTNTVFVVDRSGSMDGAPMEQAKNALRACLGALGPEDAFNILAFDNEVEEMSPGMAHGDRTGRDLANRFLETVDARGGTELQQALHTAAEMLKGSGGDIFLLTDGQVYETESIIIHIKSLGLRVHVLGIGSASQDRFLSQLARQSGGNSRFMTPSERVDQAAMELFASIASPVAKNLKATGVIDAPASTAFSGVPVQLFGEAKGEEVEMHYEQNGENKALRIPCPEAGERGETLRLLRGARLITEFESQMDTPAHGAAAKREGKRAEHKLEQLSREYGLASRAMSLVAVVESEQEESGVLARTKVVPVGLPEDVQMDAYFGESADMACFSMAPSPSRSMRKNMARSSMVLGAVAEEYDDGLIQHAPCDAMQEEPDLLMILASQLEPDGGMPGDDEEARIAASLFALLCFVSNGRGATGMYSRHIDRLKDFLVQHGVTSKKINDVIAAAPQWDAWEATALELLNGTRLDATRYDKVLREVLAR